MASLEYEENEICIFTKKEGDLTECLRALLKAVSCGHRATWNPNSRNKKISK